MSNFTDGPGVQRERKAGVAGITDTELAEVFRHHRWRSLRVASIQRVVVALMMIGAALVDSDRSNWNQHDAVAAGYMLVALSVVILLFSPASRSMAPDRRAAALKLYRTNASLPLEPVNPTMFPRVNDADFKPDFGDFNLPTPDDGLLGSGLPALPAGLMPKMPHASKPQGAATKVPAPPAGLVRPPGVKPASFGGAGAGLPQLPLQSWDAGAAVAAQAGAGLGKIPVPAGYATLNGAGAVAWVCRWVGPPALTGKVAVRANARRKKTKRCTPKTGRGPRVS